MHEINVDTDLLAINEEIARKNKRIFDDHKIYVFNLMSAPGSGKTSLLERTIPAMKGKFKMAVIEGDIQSTQDSDRIRSLSVPVMQINTGSLCHLDARMIHKSLPEFHIDDTDLLIIENVGNLVCPAEFNLGEDDKIMIYSLTEGHDKPKKYPLIFHRSCLILINKIDLRPHVDFDMQKVKKEIMEINPHADVIEISCRTGQGINGWIHWLERRMERKKFFS